jgi:uncharacterized membrane protein
MDEARNNADRAHALGLAGFATFVGLVVVALSLTGAEITGVTSLAYWPLFPALAVTAVLIGVPTGALLGWSKPRRKVRRASSRSTTR